MIYSERSPDAENVVLGATLEIQRLQREEILEQQLLRQQVSYLNEKSPGIYNSSTRFIITIIIDFMKYKFIPVY